MRSDHQENLCNMETKNKPKNFDAVAFMREQRDIISEKLSNMSKEEILAYLKKLDESTRKRVRPGA